MTEEEDIQNAGEEPENAKGSDPRQPGAEPGPAAGPDPRVFASFLGSLGGPRRSIHEVGVNGSVIEQTARFVDAHLKPEVDIVDVPEPGDNQAVVILTRTGLEVVDPAEFDQWRTNPRFRGGTATLLSLDSFIAHVNRFGDHDTVVFGNNDRDRPTLTAVLDYHRADRFNEVGEAETPGRVVGEARFGRHRSAFAFPLADEWLAWRKMDKQVMKMSGFAAFLEDHIIDVIPGHLVALGDEEQTFMAALGSRGTIADPSRLMDLATGLQINERNAVSEVVNLGDGTGQVSFQSEHVDAAGNKLTIPGLFVIGIPVFRGGERYQIIARLRYRNTHEGIVFWYELWRLDRVFDHAFNGAVERVQIETVAPVLLGIDEGDCSPVRRDD